MGGIIRTAKGTLYAVGGADDHVHLYLRWRTDDAISDLIRDVKVKSSSWIHANFPKRRAFAWQTGYAVFSVSKSQEMNVKSDIVRQREHHRRTDFKSELLKLLRAHEIEFDPRFVFDRERTTAPAGADGMREIEFHGFRCASPVATDRGPSGAMHSR